MNNGLLITEDLVVDTSSVLLGRKAELVKLISAINALAPNPNWQIIKELLFDGQVERLEKQLLQESKNLELNNSKIQRLNGNLEWAKRFDLYKLAESYKLELLSINKQLPKDN